MAREGARLQGYNARIAVEKWKDNSVESSAVQ